MSDLAVGSIVRCRNREWVVLPSSNENLYLLRPLTGSENEICGIDKRLCELGIDPVEPATFPLPKPEDVGDFVATELLWNAARLSLREGAGPFRSFGKISVRPRAYQLVPLIMSLRLNPVRLFIADDVGIGKTIEALLIARELLDRGEIRRFCVLCPPYLCDQWQAELKEKFHIDAVVIRSGTVSQLERELPSQDQSIFGYFPFTVVSIDYAKADAHKANFLSHCPELVIVDEIHGAAKPSGDIRGQQQRHELVKAIASDPARSLILLSATPHSGIEEAFLSLLGLINPDFAKLDLSNISDKDRDRLAMHFIQRRRADVANWIGEETPFPERDSSEETYELSPAYRKLFDHVYSFSSELIRTVENLTGWRKRIRFWTALALLRCVMSSPAAAVKALQIRGKDIGIDMESEDEAYSSYIYEDSENETIDVLPTNIVEESEKEFQESEKRKLRDLLHLAKDLKNSADTKLLRCLEIVRKLLKDGFQPIIWCRYIATSDYVAQELNKQLEKEFKEIRVISVNGALAEEERKEKIIELTNFKHRILVATDCLSEGINLQDYFTAVIHYDLPWNPNRLEQREGRVDRFGQKSKLVKSILFYGRDNPVDGAVLDVLLRKAKKIRNELGISVPVPIDSETIMEAVLNSLFKKVTQPGQLLLFEEEDYVKNLHTAWEKVKEREKMNRSKFAQRAIKPDEVKKELEEVDSVLGDPGAVQKFVLNACQRLGVSVDKRGDSQYVLTGLENLPNSIKMAIPNAKEAWMVSFSSPPPENTCFLGRNHPFVAALAQFLLEEALVKNGSATAPRCGIVRTNIITRKTNVLLLRIRYSLQEPGKTPLLAEEAMICGFMWNTSGQLEWLSEDSVLSLLPAISPVSNIGHEERKELIAELLNSWEMIKDQLEPLIIQRAQRVADSHRRVRSAVQLKIRGLSVSPYFPPDLIGVLILLPVPKGVVK
ncbi:MAG: helicase-related protein [Candidatus Saccharicenans sp.]